MENNIVSKQTISFGLSLAVCAVLNALVVIAKESSKGVADWMQKITGHHWTTHVAIILVLFGLFGGCFTRMNGGAGPGMSADQLTRVVLWGVVAGVVIILGFYVIAD
jgi:hypothetical protein